MALSTAHTSRGRSALLRGSRAAAGIAVAALTAGLLSGFAAPARAAAPTPSAKPTTPTAPGSPAKPASPPKAPALDPTAQAQAQAQHDASVQAKKSGKPVVVDALTAENAQTLANPDGTFTLQQSAAPVRARKNNAWVPVDTKLTKSAGGRYAPGATDADVSFSAGGTDPLISMVREGKRISISWPGSLPKPTVSGDTATYPSVLPDVDLTVTARADGFSEVLVVKSAAAAADPALATLHFATTTDGLSLGQDSAGDATATDAGGTTIFRADPPLVWDSATRSTPPSTPPAAPRAAANAGAAKADANPTDGAPAGQPAADPQAVSGIRGPGDSAHTTRMGFTVGKNDLAITPDKGLLTDSHTIYPLYIDPAWSGNPSVVSWASINSAGWKATTGNTAKAGYLGNWSGCGSYCYQTYRSYFEMNTAGFQGAKVTDAHFYPYFTWNAASGQDSKVFVDPDFGGDLAWGNKPGGNYVTNCGGCNTGTVDFNVTSAAQGAANGGWRDLEVEAANEGDQNDWKQLDPTQTNWSVTYYTTPYINNTWPQLITTPQTNGPGGTFVTGNSVTMQATGGDSDGEQVMSGYEIYNAPGGNVGSLVHSQLWSPYSAVGGSYTFSGLADGQYVWHALIHSHDGNLESGWSAWVPFTVSTAVPPAPDAWSVQFPKNQFGAAYQDNGTFTFTTYNNPNVYGYIFSLDGDLGYTVWNQSAPPPTFGGGTPSRGQQYWVRYSGDMTPVTLSVPTVGPHVVYVKAVSAAGYVSSEFSYGFWAGVTTPRYVTGDQLAGGYSATNDDNSTTSVPSAVVHGANGANVISQGNWWQTHWAGAGQAMFGNGSGAVGVNDTATFSFDVPHAGYWSLGANLTKAGDYGQYNLVLDQGSATPSTLITGYDGYTPAPNVATEFHDFGPPKDSSGNVIKLAQGLHTITLIVTGKNGSSGGYQAGIDVLRLAPMSATCKITDLTACQNNIAISADNNHLAADADGGGISFSAGQLAAAGWNPNTPITVNGAPMTVPNYSVGKADNILSSGQTVTVNDTGQSAVGGNSVEFLAFSTAGNVTGATGTITYPTQADGKTSTCGTTTSYPYTLDNVPDWSNGAPSSHVVGFANRNTPSGTDPWAPQLYPVSIALPCPGLPIQSVTLPVVTNRLVYGTTALHIMGVGIRPASYVPGTSLGSNWTATWGAQQDTHQAGVDTRTERTSVTTTLGGSNARIHLSNALGTQPITLDHVTIAQQQSGPTPTATPVNLTFNGQTSVTIPAGSEATSDGLAFPTTSGEVLLISYHLATATSDAALHLDTKGSTTWYSATAGDATTDSTGTPFTTSNDSVYWLTGVDVAPTSNNTGALALVGDQTVNSDTTTPDGHHMLSDLIYGDVVQAYNNDPIDNPAPYGVISESSNSWTVANNLLPALSGSSNQLTPPSATDPIDRTALDASNVHTVLISTGTSDLLSGTNATDLENRLGALAQQIRQRYADANGGSRKIGVYVATIPPSLAITGAAETTRQTVNNYILCGKSDPTAGICTSNSGWLGGKADGAINFAAALATDHTDTGPLNATRDLYTDSTGKQYPSQLYYEDLAAQYTKDSANLNPTTPGGGVGVQPMTARRAQ
ncbi:hypothetical protein ACFZB9_23185 [Kitasatospora sp. NPDC008050]|uniref:hypothetical protein n=1 Tax=Kitasatospora sp. NPDC008050 TaxID=3364021 RepID=UPI0036E30421